MTPETCLTLPLDILTIYSPSITLNLETYFRYISYRTCTVGCTTSYFVEIIWFSRWFCNPNPLWDSVMLYLRSPKDGCCSISHDLSCSSIEQSKYFRQRNSFMDSNRVRVRPVTVTFQPTRLSTYFMTLIPILTFTELRVGYIEHLLRNGMPAGNACPSRQLVPYPFWGLDYAPIVETSFTELAVYFSTFHPEYPSPRVLSRFSCI